MKETPPQLAAWLLRFCAQGLYADDMIGDLHEEFAAKSATSVRNARLWFWQQVCQSIPRILHRQSQRAGAYRLSILVLTYMVALLVINLWDMYVSRAIVQSIYTTSSEMPLVAIRVLYFLFFTIGAVLTGAISAAVGFGRDQSLLSNLVLSVLPVFILITGLMVLKIIVTGDYDFVAYLVLRSAILAPTLLAGAYLYHRWKACD